MSTDLPQDDTDSELVARALTMFAAWLETGNVTVSAADVAAYGAHSKVKAKVLDADQQQLVARIRRLAGQFYEGAWEFYG